MENKGQGCIEGFELYVWALRQIKSILENNFKITHPTIRIMVMRDHEPKVFTDLRSTILPAKFQYLTTGLSSTIYTSWEGHAVAEYWLHINSSLTLQVHVGMMEIITSNAANGHAVIATRPSSLLFAIVATIFGIILT
jgi:ABC-type anion transport system duplicated permease subunit